MTTKPAYPKKLFYRIQEVATIVGVEAYVLRYWETKFPMLKPEKDGSDQRRYRQKDIEVLLRIRQLLHVEKYTIAGAVEKLREERSGRTLPTERRAIPPRPQPLAELFEAAEPPPGADSSTPSFNASESGLAEEQLERLRRVRDELGLLRRELENWRDELA